MASIFSKIINGELPGHFVFQDDHCVAIMTIAPLRPGHVLVIPRQEIDHFDDLSAELASHLMVVSQKVAKAIKLAFPCERCGMVIAGLEVPHTHIHLFPVNEISDFDFTQAAMADQDDLKAAAEKLRAALQ